MTTVPHIQTDGWRDISIAILHSALSASNANTTELYINNDVKYANRKHRVEV